MKDLANELIIGLVTGVGSNNNAIIQALKEAFKAVCYEECHIIECKISNLFTSENFNKIQDKEIDGKINSIREKLKDNNFINTYIEMQLGSLGRHDLIPI